MRMTSHHLCHILLVRRKSLDYTPTQGERIMKGHECQEVVIMIATLRVCFP